MTNKISSLMALLEIVVCLALCGLGVYAIIAGVWQAALLLIPAGLVAAAGWYLVWKSDEKA